ncbi:MAG: ATP-grasp domain-containing protein [Candidatus Poseidoniia archaeon]|jgi:biotin carboxylase|nr:ATP-grasp domain-containing protein [Candidatus Poseidoniia archaeon]MDP6659036.1 ATP-grasp domain-containing protein [Candidatus Poseidoniia archaeon]MDP7007054.1 ATP-grasp domain-containing protein [Candidatus Poseidoniia archaeon]
MRLLLLVPSTTYRAGPFTDAARALGIDVTIGCEEQQTLTGLLPEALLTLSFGDPRAAAAAAGEFAREHPLDAVLAVDDGATEAAAAIAAALGLRHHPPAAVAVARDKLRCREMLAAAGLPQPRCWLVTDGEVPEEVPFPCVVKPRQLSASQGVMRADDAGGLRDALARLRALLAQPMVAQAAGEGLLLEEFIPGPEVAVEALARDGRVEVLEVFAKPGFGEGPFFPEETYVAPAGLDAPQRELVAATTARAAAALGLREGAIHAELRLHDGEAWVIDIAGRSIGGLCASALRFGGISLEEMLLRHALGHALPSLERDGSAVGVRMLYPPRAGTLRTIRGQGAAEAVTGVTGIRITAHRGQELLPPPEGGAYLGFIFAVGETAAEVVAALAAAAAKLDIRVDAQS